MAAATKILIYACSSEHCPPKERFHARILFEGKLMPVYVSAETEDGARERVRAWWRDQMAAARSNAEGKRGKPKNTSITPEMLKAIDAGS